MLWISQLACIQSTKSSSPTLTSSKNSLKKIPASMSNSLLSTLTAIMTPITTRKSWVTPSKPCNWTWSFSNKSSKQEHLLLPGIPPNSIPQIGTLQARVQAFSMASNTESLHTSAATICSPRIKPAATVASWIPWANLEARIPPSRFKLIWQMDISCPWWCSKSGNRSITTLILPRFLTPTSHKMSLIFCFSGPSIPTLMERPTALMALIINNFLSSQPTEASILLERLFNSS